MNKMNIILIILIIPIGLYIMYYMFKSKEGFQTSQPPTKNTPATCLIMLSAYERMNNNLQNAKNANDVDQVKNMEIALKSVEVEMKNMGC